mmetsp:Transcript_16524/g.40664  ORF Transcript_16524/g.40664 Transcript_16524/m.40664 type:complete len:227 (-) Transcript_16524:588-1268(-)
MHVVVCALRGLAHAVQAKDLEPGRVWQRVVERVTEGGCGVARTCGLGLGSEAHTAALAAAAAAATVATVLADATSASVATSADAAAASSDTSADAETTPAAAASSPPADICAEPAAAAAAALNDAGMSTVEETSEVADAPSVQDIESPEETCEGMLSVEGTDSPGEKLSGAEAEASESPAVAVDTLPVTPTVLELVSSAVAPPLDPGEVEASKEEEENGDQEANDE